MRVIPIAPSIRIFYDNFSYLKLTYILNATLLLNKVVDDDFVMSSKQTLVSK